MISPSLQTSWNAHIQFLSEAVRDLIMIQTLTLTLSLTLTLAVSCSCTQSPTPIPIPTSTLHPYPYQYPNTTPLPLPEHYIHAATSDPNLIAGRLHLSDSGGNCIFHIGEYDRS